MRLFKKIVLLFLCISAGALYANDWTGPELQAVWDAYEISVWADYEASIITTSIAPECPEGDVCFAEMELCDGTVCIDSWGLLRQNFRRITNLPPYRDGLNIDWEVVAMLYEDGYYCWDAYDIVTPERVYTIYDNTGDNLLDRLDEKTHLLDEEKIYKKVGNAYIHVHTVNVLAAVFAPMGLIAQRLKWNILYNIPEEE